VELYAARYIVIHLCNSIRYLFEDTASSNKDIEGLKNT